MAQCVIVNLMRQPDWAKRVQRPGKTVFLGSVCKDVFLLAHGDEKNEAKDEPSRKEGTN